MTTKFPMEILEFGVEEVCAYEETVPATLPKEDDLNITLEQKNESKENTAAQRRSTRTTARSGSQSESGADEDSQPSNKGTPCTRSSRGRADSGALLDMLAEVASQKLLFSPMKTSDRSGSDGQLLSAAQIKNSSTNQLIKMFSLTEFDEMKKWYKYKCTLDDCSEVFGSFGSEIRAKDNFKRHLLQHLETLKASEAISSISNKGAVKKGGGLKRGRKPRGVRELVKEDDESQSKDEDEDTEEESMLAKVDDWDDSNFILPELENKVEVEVVGCEQAQSEKEREVTSDLKEAAENSAAVNLNRLIAGLSEKMGVSGEHSYSSNDNVMIYVVEGDSMVLKSVVPSSLAHQIDLRSDANTLTSDTITLTIPVTSTSETSTTNSSSNPGSEYPVIRSAELPIIANNQTDKAVPPAALQDPSALWELNNGENIERDEFMQRRKPKGKAKFIGQSRMEKEMAIAAIEAIRTKSSGSGLETLQCNICQPPRTFTAPTTLISHYRSHAGIKPFECRVCEAVFTRQHSLNYHMLIHANQTRFTCTDCGRKFRHPSHFREHRRRHTGESPFECSDCLMRFKTRNTYKRHLRTRHGKVLTTSGGLIILSEEQFQMVRTGARTSAQGAGGIHTVEGVVGQKSKGRPKKQQGVSVAGENLSSGEIEAIDEDMRALHQLEIVTANDNYDEQFIVKEEPMDMNEMQHLMPDEEVDESYADIVKEAVRLESEVQPVSTQKNMSTIKEELQEDTEETFVVDTEDPLSVSGLYLATLEDGETVLVDTRGALSNDDGDGEGQQSVDLGFKVLGMSKVAVTSGSRIRSAAAASSSSEPTVIVVKNDPVF